MMKKNKWEKYLWNAQFKLKCQVKTELYKQHIYTETLPHKLAGKLINLHLSICIRSFSSFRTK